MQTNIGEKEFAISFAEDGVASLSSSIRRFSNKAIELAKKYPEQTKLHINNDGSVYLQFPPEWIKMPSPKKQMSAENKEKAALRMKKARESRKTNE